MAIYTLLLVIYLSLSALASDLSAQNGTRCYAKDDEVYSEESCGTYDSDSCTDYCYKSAECTTLCGEECENSAGALCAFTILSDIEDVCLNFTSDEELRRLDGSSRVSRVLGYNAEITKSTVSVTQAACDDHAYCEFCLGNEMCVHVILDIGKRVLTTALYDNLIYTGAAPMAMVLIGYLSEVCDVLAEDTMEQQLHEDVKMETFEKEKEIQQVLPSTFLLFGGLVFMAVTVYGVKVTRRGHTRVESNEQRRLMS